MIYVLLAHLSPLVSTSSSSSSIFPSFTSNTCQCHLTCNVNLLWRRKERRGKGKTHISGYIWNIFCMDEKGQSSGSSSKEMVAVSNWYGTISPAIAPNLSRTVQFVLNHHHLGKGEEKEACGGCGRSNYGENHTHTRYERAEKSPVHLGRKSN